VNIRNNNFVGAARRELQEGGFAVEPSLMAGCGLEAHDSDPSEAWTSSMLAQFNHEKLLSNPLVSKSEFIPHNQ
jgi:hypothetical protein